jgi:hypothetical protein
MMLLVVLIIATIRLLLYTKSQKGQVKQQPLTYKQREYGMIDNRILTSLLHA